MCEIAPAQVVFSIGKICSCSPSLAGPSLTSGVRRPMIGGPFSEGDKALQLATQ
jgi:hypothetical protein